MTSKIAAGLAGVGTSAASAASGALVWAADEPNIVGQLTSAGGLGILAGCLFWLLLQTRAEVGRERDRYAALVETIAKSKGE